MKAAAIPRPWRATLVACALAVGAVLFLYWDTALSMVRTWWRSGTYAHGFLIIPISAWLIWGRRRELAAVSPRPVPWLLGGLAALGAVWLTAHAVEIVIVQQLCLVAMLITTIVVLIGWRAARLIMFPLAFLIFAVPMGEDLISPLMHFTAAFTVKALQLTGIPVFSEGMYITLPNGSWEVAEACSGLRYLIASVTLGFLYAYLMYRSYGRRILFIAVSFVVPVFANGIRAYMIVMIGYLSGMKLAVGVDHIIYGWVLFGIIIGILFYIGSFWREDAPGEVDPLPAANGPVTRGEDPSAARRTGIAAAGIAVIALLWPALAMHMQAEDGPVEPLGVPAPAAERDWHPLPVRWDWTPRYLKPQGQVRQFYDSPNGVVGVYLEYYRDQRQGAELVDSQNLLVTGGREAVWRKVADRKRPIRLQGRTVTIHEARLESPTTNLLVWQWYWIAGQVTANDYVAKLLEAKDKLLDGRTRSASILLATDFDVHPDKARARLQRFVAGMYPAIEQALMHAGGAARRTATPGRRADGAVDH